MFSRKANLLSWIAVAVLVIWWISGIFESLLHSLSPLFVVIGVVLFIVTILYGLLVGDKKTPGG